MSLDSRLFDADTRDVINWLDNFFENFGNAYQSEKGYNEWVGRGKVLRDFVADCLSYFEGDVAQTGKMALNCLKRELFDSSTFPPLSISGLQLNWVTIGNEILIRFQLINF